MAKKEGCKIKNEIVSFQWKNEGDSGPLYAILRDGSYTNYKNGMKSFDGTFNAKWYTLASAQRMAKMMGLKLEQI